MIFKKRLRYQYEWSEGKATAFRNKSKRELNRDIKKFPLLEPVLEASEQTLTVEEERERRIISHCEYDQRLRDSTARSWRNARSIYFSLPKEVKAIIMERWNSRMYPLESVNFAHIVDVESGNQAIRLNLIAQLDKARKKDKGEQLSIF